MILNVSGRTDIVAFYSDWFMDRYRKGFVDVRNPFNPKLISRINYSSVDAILFCTKNPEPILKYRKFTENDYKEIGISFSTSAKLHNMTVQTCFEDRNLAEYGFVIGECYT